MTATPPPPRRPDNLLQAAAELHRRILTPPVVLPVKLAEQLGALCVEVHEAGIEWHLNGSTHFLERLEEHQVKLKQV